MDTSPVNPVAIETRRVEALQTVFDPEITINIWEVGLIYRIKVDPSGAVGVPSAEELPVEVGTKVKAVPGVTAVKVEVVFDPPWAPDMMSGAARLELGMM